MPVAISRKFATPVEALDLRLSDAGVPVRQAQDPTPPSAPDAELLALGRLFDAAWRHETDCWKAVTAAEGTDQVERLDEIAREASGVTGAFADRIEALSATTLAGVIIKVRACAWCNGGEAFTEDFFGTTMDMRLAAGVMRDLTAMCGGQTSGLPVVGEAA